jgi:hypothetical protein
VTWVAGHSGNPAGPPPGPKKNKIWREALERAIKRREHDDPQALEKLADSLLRKVGEGDVSAIRELGDRLDGKVTQTHGGDDEKPPIEVLHRVLRVIVRPGD